MCVYVCLADLMSELWQDLNTLNKTVLGMQTGMKFRMSFMDILKRDFNLIESIMAC